MYIQCAQLHNQTLALVAIASHKRQEWMNTITSFRNKYNSIFAENFPKVTIILWYFGIWFSANRNTNISLQLEIIENFEENT